MADDGACPRCGKMPPLCVCAEVVPIQNRIRLVILQHPQEQDVDLGTARLTALHFRNAAVRIGLSWPSLSKALGLKPGEQADPKRWAVLYLGSARPATFPPGRTVVALDKKGEPAADQEQALKYLQGVIVLDGTWAQVKTLWWRNPWLLKVRRIALNPARPSRYGQLRREARREALSSLEAAALVMSTLENNPAIAETLHHSFDRLLTAFRSRART
ncbi:MAG: tRNA-uridine aminocarboxypropyltransferase [Rhodospirillaceae bacterium]